MSSEQKFTLATKDGTGPVRRWFLSDRPLLIGRARDCDLIVFDPLVSRRHCQIWALDGKLRFQDMGSANTTEVNGAPRSEGELFPGDELRIGDQLFIVSVDAPTTHPDGDETPITVAASDTPYYSKVRSTAIDSHGIESFGTLLTSTRRFSQAASLSELCDTLESILENELGAVSSWFALYTDRGRSIVRERTPRHSSNTPNSEFEQVRELARGVLAPAPAASPAQPRWFMAAPMEVGGNIFGAVAILVPAADALNETFNYFVALIHTLGPFYRALERTGQASRDLERVSLETDAVGALIGVSEPVVNLRQQLRHVAASDLNVLILGETGTGKELVSRLLHDLSARADRPFVVVNCPSIPAELFESVMFGHKRGSFTGAMADRDGYFLEAQGGTLFLDEIGDLPPHLQTRLLRAVETGSIRIVGGDRDIQTDVRIVAATNRLAGLDDEADHSPFRSDLYHRLAGFEIALPPLRNRRDDIPHLAAHFLGQLHAAARTRAKRFEPAALERLQRWHWPGNVRELLLCVERAAVLCDGETISESNVVLWGSRPNAAGAPPVESTLAAVEMWHVERALAHCAGNVTATAALLGISRSTLYEKLRRLDSAPQDATDAFPRI